jgi:hypothetical protein
MSNRNNAQIAMEFLLLISLAFFIVIVFLAATYSVSKGNAQIQAHTTVDDLGKSLQQEFLLASGLEDGYTRKINLPMTVNGVEYSAFIGQTSPQNNYLLLSFEDSSELFYMIPPIIGNISLGDNVLRKINGTLRLN